MSHLIKFKTHGTFNLIRLQKMLSMETQADELAFMKQMSSFCQKD